MLNSTATASAITIQCMLQNNRKGEENDNKEIEENNQTKVLP